MLLALLKLAQADYLCPSSPPTKEDFRSHISAYVQLSTARELCQGVVGELGLILGAFAAALAAPTEMEKVLQYSKVVGMLAAPACGQRGLQRQMEQLAGSREERERLPTPAQLQHSCCNDLLALASVVRSLYAAVFGRAAGRDKRRSSCGSPSHAPAGAQQPQNPYGRRNGVGPERRQFSADCGMLPPCF